MIKKFTTTHKGKKYNAIIESDEDIIIGKIYPARYEEAVMSNKAPEWFTNWSTKFEKEVFSRLDRLEKRMVRVEQRLDKVEQRLDKVEQRLDKVEQRLSKIENCPTIKSELK